MKTDKGLRQAAHRQPEYRLPSNFSFRMMQQINQEAYRSEKRKERRSYLFLGILCTLMAGSCFALIGWWYKDSISSIMRTLVRSLPEYSAFSFYLPMLIALPLLYLFNRWLKRILR